MADATAAPGDPLTGFTPSSTGSTTDPGDPLANFKPGGSVAPAITPPPPTSSGDVSTFLDKAWKRITMPSNPDARLGPEPMVGPAETIRAAPAAGYAAGGEGSVVQPDITYPSLRNIFTPEFQRSWAGRNLLNAAGTAAGTTLAGLSAAGNAVGTLGTETARALGAPESLIRDANLFATSTPFAPELRPFTTSPSYRAAVTDAPALKAAMEPVGPPPATLSEVLDRQRAARIAPLRAAPNTDPVTANLIATLKQAQGASDIPAPSPPAPFTPTQQPQPTAPSGGLLGAGAPPAGQPPGGLLGPRVGAQAPMMPAPDMRTIAEGYFSPADKQAAQGAMIGGEHANGIRGVLTDTVPTDPQKAIAQGDTPLTTLGKAYAPLQGQPMSFDAVMTLDRRLTAEKQMAYRAGNDDLGRQIGNAQDAIRDKMQSLPDSATTGDASTLANLAPARQAYSQYVKQSQIDDINYRVGLLKPEQQTAALRRELTSLAKNDGKMASWLPDERAALEDQIKSGNIGTLTGFGLSLIKPAVQAGGGYIGGTLAGAPGAYVGAQVGGSLGETAASRLRGYLSGLTTDPVSRQLTANMPPPPVPFRPAAQ